MRGRVIFSQRCGATATNRSNARYERRRKAVDRQLHSSALTYFHFRGFPRVLCGRASGTSAAFLAVSTAVSFTHFTALIFGRAVLGHVRPPSDRRLSLYRGSLAHSIPAIGAFECGIGG